MRLFIIFILLQFGAVIEVMANGYTVTIEHTIEDGLLVVQPTVNSPHQESLHYKLMSEKHGESGQSKTSQSGSIFVEASQPMVLSTLKLGVNASDEYIITLKVFAGETLIGEDQLRYRR